MQTDFSKNNCAKKFKQIFFFFNRSVHLGLLQTLAVDALKLKHTSILKPTDSCWTYTCFMWSLCKDFINYVLIISNNYSLKFRRSELACKLYFLFSRGSPKIPDGSHQMPQISNYNHILYTHNVGCGLSCDPTVLGLKSCFLRCMQLLHTLVSKLNSQ